jgi:UrcA family protein
MITQFTVRHCRLSAPCAALVAVSCTLGANTTRADTPLITVAIHVNAKGLDLTQEQGTRKFYQRIEFAAWVACNHADRVGLSPVEHPMQCADQSLASAIRSASMPALTRIYLETHTPQQASVAGISLPLSAAAR